MRTKSAGSVATTRFPNTVKHFRTIQPVVYILGLAGVALFIVLLIREGAEQVGLAIARAGWGLLGLVLYHQVQTLTDAAGWLVLIPKQNRVRLSSSFFLHWVAASIKDLLPTARVGGDIVLAGKFENMSESERNTMLDECFIYNDELRKNGHLVAEEPLQPANTAVTVSWKNGKVAVTDGRAFQTRGLERVEELSTW
jgi:hypothetical protein